MTKKGPLSKAEKFYIENKHKESELDTLCKDLDRAKSIVKSHITKCKKSESANKVPDLSSQFASSRGATVMTPNASQMSDGMKKSSENTRQGNCTTSIK